MNIPTSYFLLKIGLPVETTFVSMVFYAIAAVFAQYILVKDIAKLNLKEFCSKVVYRNVLIVLLSSVIPLYIRLTMADSFLRLVCVVSTSLLSCGITYWLIGFSKNEKLFLKEYVNKKIGNIGRNRK